MAKSILLAGAAGNLGSRIARALGRASRGLPATQ